MWKKLGINTLNPRHIVVHTLFFFLVCLSFAHAQTAPAQPAQGSCNTQTNTVYGPNGTDSGIPCPGSTLSNDGIFGCMGLGAQVQNVGTRTAIGGVYVPVNDAAVTLNTGFLVYKECILDGVARKIGENAAAEMTRQGLRSSSVGRNGRPQFPEDVTLNQERIRWGNKILLDSMSEAYVGVLCPAIKNPVRTTIVRSYLARQNQPTRSFACSLPGQNASFYETLAAFREPKNNPYGAWIILQDDINARIAYNEYSQRQRLLSNNGFFDTTSDPDDPLGARIITPGYLIAQSIAQMTGSGFRQLENANEIDQVVGNLFGGLTTQLVSDTRGLIGLTQPVNGQPSYLDRMISQTSSSVRQQAANAALSIIGAARQIESNYRQAKEGIASALTDAITKLRSAEQQCWNLIIPAVQSHAQQNGNPTLNIATSTQGFAQTIIDAQIAPLATTTIRDIRASDEALRVLNQLIADVSNSASQANQQQALLRLDTMVANRQLHTATDANNAVQQKDSVVNAVTKLVDDTIKSWGDDTDPTIGWCNVNNTAVVERWFNAWR